MDYLLFKEVHQLSNPLVCSSLYIISDLPPQTSHKNSFSTLLSPSEATVRAGIFKDISKYHLFSLKSASHGQAVVPVSMYLLTFAEVLSFFDHICMISKNVWTINYLITSIGLYFHLMGFVLSLLRVQGFRPHWWSEVEQTHKLSFLNSTFAILYIIYITSRIRGSLQAK